MKFQKSPLNEACFGSFKRAKFGEDQCEISPIFDTKYFIDFTWHVLSMGLCIIFLQGYKKEQKHIFDNVYCLKPLYNMYSMQWNTFYKRVRYCG